MSSHMQKNLLRAAVATSLLVSVTSSHASLIPIGEVTLTGTGLGTVSTILTIQSRANTTTATGSVIVDTAGNDQRFGDAKPGASQTLTRSIGEVGIAKASDISIIFNADQPAGNGITLDNLVLRIYNPTGGILFSSGLFTPKSFPTTSTGIGKSGFEYKLDATQAAIAQSAFVGADFSLNRFGLLASASNAPGGPETFFIRSNTNPTPGDDGGPSQGNVPEPATVALFGLGILGVALVRRRTKKSTVAFGLK